MLQYLIDDILPGYSLPQLSVYENRRDMKLYFYKDYGMVALDRDSKGWLRILYEDLTYVLGCNTWKDSLTCEEAIKIYLR